MQTPRETAKPAAASRKMFLWFAFRVACSMPRVSGWPVACHADPSGMDDAHGISAHHIFLSSCVVRCMRVCSLPALLSEAAGRSAAQGRRAFRESGPSLPAQAPESQCLPLLVAEVGEMRENSPEQPPPRGFQGTFTTV
jgi:hypothetical protein